MCIDGAFALVTTKFSPSLARGLSTRPARRSRFRTSRRWRRGRRFLTRRRAGRTPRRWSRCGRDAGKLIDPVAMGGGGPCCPGPMTVGSPGRAEGRLSSFALGALREHGSAARPQEGNGRVYSPPCGLGESASRMRGHSRRAVEQAPERPRAEPSRQPRPGSRARGDRGCPGRARAEPGYPTGRDVDSG